MPESNISISNQETLSLEKNMVNWIEPLEKLNPKWEGLYRVAEISENNYYKLAYRDGTLVPQTWHAENLKLYYIGRVWNNDLCFVLLTIFIPLWIVFYFILFYFHLSLDLP